MTARAAITFLGLVAVTGCVQGLFSLAFVTYYRAVKRFDLLFGSYFVLGAYTAYFSIHSSWPLTLIFVSGGIVIVLLLAVFADRVVYRTISGVGGSPALCLVASLGLATVCDGLIRLFVGDQAVAAFPQSRVMVYVAGLGTFTTGQIVALSISFMGFAAGAWILEHSEIGLRARAASANQGLAQLHGMSMASTQGTVAIATACATAIAGAAYSFDLEIHPSVGTPVFMVAVAVCLASPRSKSIRVLLLASSFAALTVAGAFVLGPRWADIATYLIFLGITCWIGFGDRLIALRSQ